jgi:hypothetical protein
LRVGQVAARHSVMHLVESVLREVGRHGIFWVE